ncbi:FKBP-type peptidyl-prolyl cis-trans isomerase [Pleionea mediterranea]|uniref:Peptidyl-prolyl cis-trans isomerase n=1 Tax=Pleionea mediterranea TaxID=523701 RepID=A0A316FRW4_9GAMM|nr:FKBP-type peptidyl-prolyl cis-trans isomerase [Pleionea mediterranea]PWK50912.1 FKBP-type peptidyl-prolyl cis-trans isomerase SlpA [Pleionea mediterranea]
MTEVIDQIVEQDSLVYTHMTLKLGDGSVADSSRANGKPSVIEMGGDAISPAMESELLGLRAGESKSFTLSAEDAFGESDPNLIQFMDLHQFPSDIELKEGSVVAFEQPNGSSVPGIISEIQGHSVKVDFNHPLAGQRITFDVEILSVNTPPTTH